MLTFPRLFVSMVVIVIRVVQALARSQTDLVLENLILRQQVMALQRERPRPHLNDVDRGVLVAFRKSWAGWATRLSIVTSQTVVKWHRRRFRRYWTRLSHENRRPGRPKNQCRIVFGERHAVRLVHGYVAYHHQDRTHLGLAKDTPDGRAISARPSPRAKVVALPRVGGLHHRYEWREAA